MKKKICKSRIQNGFSMIEMAVVLTVIGLIGISSLVYSASSIEHNKIVQTREKMNYIFDVIKLYAEEYDQLPCPADPALLITDNNFGIGTGTGVTFASPTSCTDAPDITAGTQNIVGGAIPVRTLQISPSYTLDAWGRRFTYVVDSDFTYSGTGVFGTGGWNDTSPANVGSIRIRNVFSVVNSEAIVAIISHGTNGHGAWVGKGGSRINKGCGIDLDEDNNASLCAAFDRNFIQKMGKTATFDDIVEYRVKWQLE